MEDLKAMFRVCVHIKKDGTRCNSPALKGGNFCFQHIGGSLREHTRARSIYNGPKLDFLYPGTRQAIQHNLFVVAQAMNDGKLELAQANTYNRIFATCERNLRRFEVLYQKPDPEPELPEIPEETPDADGVNGGEQNPSASSVSSVVNPSSNGDQPPTTKAANQPTQIPIPTEVSTANAAEEPACSDSPNNDVILSGATAGSEVEGPAFFSLTHRTSKNTDAPSADGGPLRRSLSEEHDPTPSEAANIGPDQKAVNPVPGPCSLSPEPSSEPSPETGPLVLTPEEIQTFTELETRYINDPSLADRIRDAYRQIREQRRAARQNSPAMPAS